jgi:RNase P subunit RPR2
MMTRKIIGIHTILDFDAEYLYNTRLISKEHRRMDMEKVFEITRQYMRRLFCDKCDSVEMQRSKSPTIALAPGQPPRHTYRCPACNATIVTPDMYPSLFTDMIELVKAEDNPPTTEVTH